MADPLEPLLLDLLEWLRPRPRAQREVLEVWRTSCPHLPVWEEAQARGLVRRDGGAGSLVQVTPTGVAWLIRHRPGVAAREDPTWTGSSS